MFNQLRSKLDAAVGHAESTVALIQSKVAELKSAIESFDAGLLTPLDEFVAKVNALDARIGGHFQDLRADVTDFAPPK